MLRPIEVSSVTSAFHHVVRGRSERVFAEFEETPYGKYEAEKEAHRKTDAHESPDFIYYQDSLKDGEEYRDHHGRRRVHRHARTKNPVTGLLK